VHIKGPATDLVEVRMFRSTLNQESFLKNLEFIDAFLAWTKETGWSVNYIDFLAWLGTKPHHYSRYANLLSYLSKDKFSLWDASRPLVNPWKEKVRQRKQSKHLTPAPKLVYDDEDN
jgi:hypothetical protein